jgi:hypothetical protein
MNSSKQPAQKRKKTYRIVLVSWGDAFIETSDFILEEAKETEPVYRKTVGFLITRNQHGLVLATDTYDSINDTFAARMFIPKGMVTDIQYLT